LRRVSINEYGRPFEIKINVLVNLEVDGRVQTEINFECQVEGMKYGTGELEYETTSKVSSYINPEEEFNNLILE
jgi:hypothetical protein